MVRYLHPLRIRASTTDRYQQLLVSFHAWQKKGFFKITKYDRKTRLSSPNIQFLSYLLERTQANHLWIINWSVGWIINYDSTNRPIPRTRSHPSSTTLVKISRATLFIVVPSARNSVRNYKSGRPSQKHFTRTVKVTGNSIDQFMRAKWADPPAYQS